mmetsp:Transcript_27974/g.45517  ORF Transcript_27974/g.45517 Transcript_27974/m.45517 type:complete len:306 (+) Transcript_27974:169-1086(+)
MPLSTFRLVSICHHMRSGLRFQLRCGRKLRTTFRTFTTRHCAASSREVKSASSTTYLWKLQRAGRPRFASSFRNVPKISEARDEEKMLPEEFRSEGLFISQRIILHNACQAFDRIDLDRNGHISCDEIEKLCHLLTMDLSRNEAAKMEHETMEHMRVMVDKTGQISKAKFVTWWLEHVDVFGNPFDPSTQKAPSIFWRAIAGLLDLVQSFTPFVALCYVGIPPNEMAFLFCGSIVLFVLRDTWTPEGRSLGKKICGLEIVQLEKTKIKDKNGNCEEAYRATSIPATRTLGSCREVVAKAKMWTEG